MMKFIFILFTLLISLFAVTHGAQRGKDIMKKNICYSIRERKIKKKNWLII